MSYQGGPGFGWNTRGPSLTPLVGVATGIRVAPTVTMPWPNVGRFRRHLNGVTVDIIGAPLGSSLVLVYDTTTRLLEAALTSDAAGTYDLPLYREGTTWFVYTNKAGTPEVFGASSNQLVPI